MKGRLWLMFILNVLVIGGAIFYVTYNNNRDKVAYVDLKELFQKFEMKKEMETALKNVQNKRQNILDSMKLDLESTSRKLQAANNPSQQSIKEFQMKKENYLNQKDFFDKSNNELINKDNDAIFKQLSQYVKDYGKQHNYTYIFSVGGSKALLYGVNNKNITQSVLTYINNQYKGKIHN